MWRNETEAATDSTIQHSTFEHSKGAKTEKKAVGISNFGAEENNVRGFGEKEQLLRNIFLKYSTSLSSLPPPPFGLACLPLLGSWAGAVAIALLACPV